MSRPLRIELAGGLYHGTSRGDRHGRALKDTDLGRSRANFGKIGQMLDYKTRPGDSRPGLQDRPCPFRDLVLPRAISTTCKRHRQSEDRH